MTNVVKQSEKHVVLIGSKILKVLCDSCCEEIENDIFSQKEAVNG